MSIDRAFCCAKQYVPSFRAYGLPDKLIWLEGRGAETLDRCLASFRGRPGRLLVAPDLTVLGTARREISAVMARLERGRIRVVDIIHPQDETVAEMIHRAANQICRTRFRDRRTARRRGKSGGLARGMAQAQKRAEIAADWVIRNIVNDPDISWDKAVEIFDGRISEATMRRRYLDEVP
jgi:hypothetical protein